ncbi:MAG: pitrilysin family protein [Candidatus Nanoarchaeia archaeon]|nr:pitrilysin family protein [Candidatus Nanoarchaeia archaeon]
MQKRVLKNGLTVLYDKRDSNSVTVNIWVKTGSDNEDIKFLGLSHFLEHILFEGTKTRSAQQIANAIEKVGGYMNAATSNDFTCYYVTVPSKYFEVALDILSDMLICSSFNQKVIDKERKVILDEISLGHDDPNKYQWILFQENLFKKINAKNPTAGTVRSVSGLTRENIINYFNEYYVPNNIAISISGKANNVFNNVSKFFGKLKRKQLPKIKKIKEPADKKITKVKEKRRLTSSYLIIGYKAPPLNHKDSFAMDVIRAILGKGQSSRLFHEIRTERGLGYVVGAEYDARKDYGLFAAFVSAAKKNIQICREIILNEFKLHGLTQKEVKEAKDYIIGSALIKNEDNGTRAENNAALEMSNLDLKTYLKGIKNVTILDVKRILKKYLNGNYTEALLEQK